MTTNPTPTARALQSATGQSPTGQSATGLRGSLTLPGDKSISHRALLLNALAKGEARVEGFLPSDDCLSSMACLRAYGVDFDYDPTTSPTTVIVRSPGLEAFTEPDRILDCGNSGTTMRLLSGLAAGFDGISFLDGDTSLRRRPMDRVLRPLQSMGAQVDARQGGRLAPLTIRGASHSSADRTSANQLRPFDGRLEVASAQVKSAVLIAALSAAGMSTIEEIGPTRDHTEIMLRAMGASIAGTPLANGGTRIEVQPGADLHPIDLVVPGDISAAAFWLVAGTIVPDSEIHLQGVGLNPTRSGILDILNAMGANIEVQEERRVGGEAFADLVVRSAPLHGITIDGPLVTRAIDEFPVIAVAAAVATGRTEVRDAAELRLKESDRVASTVAMLQALGANIEPRDDGFVVAGSGSGHNAALRGARLDSVGDHRLAMAAAVAALVAEGDSELHGAESVAISYPEFWRHLADLTGTGALT
jgi:3-phosphoshikimate 1-carboxyvinyltransferase